MQVRRNSNGRSERRSSTTSESADSSRNGGTSVCAHTCGLKVRCRHGLTNRTDHEPSNAGFHDVIMEASPGYEQFRTHKLAVIQFGDTSDVLSF